MKSLKKIAGICLVMLLIPTFTFAWSYKFINKSKFTIEVSVYGEHLFWEQLDGKSPKINPGGEYTISMPSGICGKYFVIEYCYQVGTSFYCDKEKAGLWGAHADRWLQIAACNNRDFVIDNNKTGQITW